MCAIILVVLHTHDVSHLRKQLSSWSLTKPSAWRKAYIIVEPTNLKCRRFKSLDMASEMGEVTILVFPSLMIGLPSGKKEWI